MYSGGQNVPGHKRKMSECEFRECDPILSAQILHQYFALFANTQYIRFAFCTPHSSLYLMNGLIDGLDTVCADVWSYRCRRPCRVRMEDSHSSHRIKHFAALFYRGTQNNQT